MRALICFSSIVVILGCQPDEVDPVGDSGPGPGVDGGATDGGGTDAPGVDAGSGACGDRRISAPEECDDGNTTSGDGCDASCLIEASMSCGDGVVDLGSGEQCDDGNTTPGDGCSDRCLVEPPPGCGDGTVDFAAGEECDDGNTAPGDGCSPACQLEGVGAFCGDGMMDPREVCDDGNTANGDGCNPTCNLTGTTTYVLGMRGARGSVDGSGMAAQIRGDSVMAVDDDYIWVAQGPGQLRRIHIAMRDIVTVASIGGAGGIATNGIDTVWVAGGNPPVIEAIDTTSFAVTTVSGGTTRCTSTACWADGDAATATHSEVRGLTWFGGFLWIVDTSADVIRRLDPATGIVTTVAGTEFANAPVGVDGIGAAARFVSPRYIVSDNSGLLYISDTIGRAIRILNATTFEVTTFAGNGTQAHVDGMGTASGPARTDQPRGLASDGTSIYWAEFGANTVRQGVAATFDVSTLVGVPGTGAYMEGTGTGASFDGPFSLAFHFRTNTLFVMDARNDVLRQIR